MKAGAKFLCCLLAFVTAANAQQVSMEVWPDDPAKRVAVIKATEPGGWVVLAPGFTPVESVTYESGSLCIFQAAPGTYGAIHTRIVDGIPVSTVRQVLLGKAPPPTPPNPPANDCSNVTAGRFGNIARRACEAAPEAGREKVADIHRDVVETMATTLRVTPEGWGKLLERDDIVNYITFRRSQIADLEPQWKDWWDVVYQDYKDRRATGEIGDMWDQVEWTSEVSRGLGVPVVVVRTARPARVLQYHQ